VQALGLCWVSKNSPSEEQMRLCIHLGTPLRMTIHTQMDGDLVSLLTVAPPSDNPT
jgi:hypothetical protein